MKTQNVTVFRKTFLIANSAKWMLMKYADEILSRKRESDEAMEIGEDLEARVVELLSKKSATPLTKKDIEEIKERIGNLDEIFPKSNKRTLKKVLIIVGLILGLPTILFILMFLGVIFITGKTFIEVFDSVDNITTNFSDSFDSFKDMSDNMNESFDQFNENSDEMYDQFQDENEEMQNSFEEDFQDAKDELDQSDSGYEDLKNQVLNQLGN